MRAKLRELAPAGDADLTRLLIESIRRYLRSIPIKLLANTLAESPYTPRELRFPLLRLAGLDIRTANVSSRIRWLNPKTTSVGPQTFLGDGCRIEGGVEIGARCLIGPEVALVTAGHPWKDDGSGVEQSFHIDAVVVGDDCWIGARAMILPGVTIGDGCVVAAGAVVASDCTPYGVYGGVPAKRLRDLPRPAKRAMSTASSGRYSG